MATRKQVTISRIFPASIDRLWQAFTSVEDMLIWYAPVGMKTPHVESDFRIDGRYSVTMAYDETGEEVTVRGTYKEIEKPDLLVYTWKWDGQEEETEVAIQLHSVSADQTEVVLKHSGFLEQPTADDIARQRTHADHRGGWTTAFDKLDALIQIP